MSWTQALRHAKAFVHKRIGGADGTANATADAGAPLGAAVGSLLTLKVNTFLRASGSLVGLPPASNRVVSISRLRVPLDGAVHRLYTSRGDAGGDESFVQVWTDAEGEPCEIAYFRRLLRLIPTTAEEQAAFMGEGGQGLGQTTFGVARAQVEGLGLDPALIEAAFGEAEGLEYTRCAGDETVDFIAPYSGVENRIDDRSGETGLRQDIVFMPYRRTLPTGQEEQLLISTEIVRDRNGDAGAREIHVDFMVGLVLTKEGVVVQ